MFLHPAITGNTHVIAIFCSLQIIYWNQVNLKVYAMQKWWKKHGNIKI